MWKGTAWILCLAALPLLGCAGDYAARQPEAATPTPADASAGYYVPPPQVYTAGPTAPAAVLVFLPGAGLAASEPGLWTAQGFDVVTPQPADVYRLVADEQAAIARLVASAEAMANAPVWLVGPDQLIETALGAAPERGSGVSGVVVTSAASPILSCSESFTYFDPGTGAPPQVQVRRSGNCGGGQPGIGARQPTVVQPLPAEPHPSRPRIIEASAVSKDLPPAARVRQLAQLIKAAPPS
jgi:hypothetical protein